MSKNAGFVDREKHLNLHMRWVSFICVFQGSDPSTYEMIQKIQTLQKRLIAKTEEVVEKELLIQEKEKLYVELKHILARQPGPEVAEQLQIYQQTMKEKTKQMKVGGSHKTKSGTTSPPPHHDSQGW